MRRYRIGIVGTGRMARHFATALKGGSSAVVLAVGSRKRDTAKAFANQFNIEHVYSSYAELVSDPGVDIVYVATPHSLHCENSLAAIEAGKSVICEKPFSINAEQAERVIARARAKRCFLMEAMWTRFLPSITNLRQILSSGLIGEVQTVIAGGAFMPAFDADHYLFNRSLGGGVLLDAGVYLVSLASMILGKPTHIHAVGALGRSGVDENDAIVLGYDQGANALLYVSLRAQSSPEMQILGSLGAVRVHAPIFAPSKLSVRIYAGESEERELPFDRNGYQYQVAHVVECLNKGRSESDIMPLDETLSIMQTMDEIRRQIGIAYPQEKPCR